MRPLLAPTLALAACLLLAGCAGLFGAAKGDPCRGTATLPQVASTPFGGDPVLLLAPALDGAVAVLPGSASVVSLTETRTRWTTPRAETSAPALALLPATGDALVVLDGESVVALDARSGGERWRSDAPLSAGAVAAIAPDGTRLALADEELRMLDGTTGDLLWAQPSADGAADDVVPTHAAFAPDGSGLAVATHDARTGNTTLRFLDAASGDERWSHEQPAGNGIYALHLGADVALLADLADAPAGGGARRMTVWALDLETGEERWSVGLAEGRPPAAPALTFHGREDGAWRVVVGGGMDAGGGVLEGWNVSAAGGATRAWSIPMADQAALWASDDGARVVTAVPRVDPADPASGTSPRLVLWEEGKALACSGPLDGRIAALAVRGDTLVADAGERIVALELRSRP